MPVITLINDWKQDALYLSRIKGALVSVNQQLHIVDLIPNLSSFDEKTAAFVLKNSFEQFPKGTIHLNFVSHYEKNVSDFIIAKYKGHFFISKNNGFLSNIIDEKPEALYNFQIAEASFAELELYPLLVKAILKDSIHKVAKEYVSKRRSAVFAPIISETNIIINTIYIDAYGNLITNMKKDVFEKHLSNKKYKIYISGKKHFVETVSESYENIKSGNLFAIFNSLNLLELGMKSTNVTDLLSIKKEDEILIEIIEKKEPEQGKIF